MITDKQLELSSSQAVTAAAASTNYLDLGSASQPGVGGDLFILVTCTEAATAAGAATVQFQLQTDDNSSFSSPTTVVETDAIGKATLVVGYQFVLPISPEAAEQYLRLYYNVGTGPLTAGKFTAQIVQGYQIPKIYADALSAP